jgi:hypothetical protein
MNDCFIHKRVSLTNSPVSFHAIWSAAANVFRASRPLRQTAEQTGSGRATLQPSLSLGR